MFKKIFWENQSKFAQNMANKNGNETMGIISLQIPSLHAYVCARYKFSTCKRYTSMYERTRSRVCLHVCTYSPRSPRAKKSMNVSKDGVSEVQVKARKYRT